MRKFHEKIIQTFSEKMQKFHEKMEILQKNETKNCENHQKRLGR